MNSVGLRPTAQPRPTGQMNTSRMKAALVAVAALTALGGAMAQGGGGGGSGDSGSRGSGSSGGSGSGGGTGSSASTGGAGAGSGRMEYLEGSRDRRAGRELRDDLRGRPSLLGHSAPRDDNGLNCLPKVRPPKSLTFGGYIALT